MRMVAGVVAAAAVMGAASLAYAATDSGKITDINQVKHSITLKDGSTFMAPKGARLSNFRVGERVTVAYTQVGGTKDAAKISPVLGSNADLGG